MFYTLKENASYNYLWQLVTANQGPDIFDQFDLEEYKSGNTCLTQQDLNLLYCDEHEGICGKGTFSIKEDPLEGFNFVTNYHSLKRSLLFIQDAAFHINTQSIIHYDHEDLGALAQKFYRAIIKEASHLCTLLCLSHIITLSKSQDNHEDLIFYGSIDFISEHKTSEGIFRITPLASIKRDSLLKYALPNSTTHLS